MWTICVPLTVQVTKNRSFSLNLNQYRNAHHMTLNTAKVQFKKLVTPLIEPIPKLKRCSIEYHYYSKTKRRSDISNICSIVDKFFSDAFVEAGKLPDDNYMYLPEVHYYFGGIDTKNPRVEIKIQEI